MNRLTSSGISYERGGPQSGPTLVLLHAGIADSRMWDPQWDALSTAGDVVRLDLRGFGNSTARPVDALSPVADVVDTLNEEKIERCHLVGASFGAGVAVEVALTRPDLVESLFLVAPGGSLIEGVSPELEVFIRAENAALDSGDVDAAVEANMVTWFDGLGRSPDDVDQGQRAKIGALQKRAFEVTANWGDLDEVEMSPPAMVRLEEITVPTLVLVGERDLDAIQTAATRVVEGILGASKITWPDAAHLPSVEKPEEFLELLQEWLAE